MVDTIEKTLLSLGIRDLNEDIMKYKGTDWENMSVSDWFHFSKANKTFKEPGISYEEMLALYTALMSRKVPMTILETGQCLGTTTRFFTIYTLKYGGRHYSIEMLLRPIFQNAMKELGLLDKFTTIKGNTMTVPWDKPIDFLFIDSEHCLTDALGEYMRYRVFLQGEAIVGFHDTDSCYGVRRTIDIIKNEIDDLELISKCDNRASAGIEFYKVKGLNVVAHKINKQKQDEETARLIEARKVQVA